MTYCSCLQNVTNVTEKYFLVVSLPHNCQKLSPTCHSSSPPACRRTSSFHALSIFSRLLFPRTSRKPHLSTIQLSYHHHHHLLPLPLPLRPLTPCITFPTILLFIFLLSVCHAHTHAHTHPPNRPTNGLKPTSHSYIHCEIHLPTHSHFSNNTTQIVIITPWLPFPRLRRL